MLSMRNSDSANGVTSMSCSGLSTSSNTRIKGSANDVAVYSIRGLRRVLPPPHTGVARRGAPWVTRRTRAAAPRPATSSPTTISSGDIEPAMPARRSDTSLPASGAPSRTEGRTLSRRLSVLPSVRDGAPLAGSDVSLRLAGIAGSMSPLLIVVGLLVAGLGAAALVRRVTHGAPRRATPVWGGGSTRLSPRMEYTATSFAEPLIRVFDDVLRPEQDIDVTPFAESEFLIESISYRQRVPDRVEARLYPPLLAAARRWGQWSRGIANGSVHRYLAYG